MGIDVPTLSFDGAEIGISDGFSGACVEICDATYSADGAEAVLVVAGASVEVTMSAMEFN